MDELCGVCGEPADVIATVPMCGKRPRYAMCLDCWLPIEEAGYCENVVMLSTLGKAEK